MFVWDRLILLLGGLLVLSWIGTGVGYVWMSGQLKSEQSAHLETKLQWKEERETYAKERNRLLENIIVTQGDLNEARQLIVKKDDDIAQLRTSARGMRNKLAAYATRPETPTSTCEGRIVILADVAAEGTELLSEGTELLRSCARDHDIRTEELKAIIKIWEQP